MMLRLTYTLPAIDGRVQACGSGRETRTYAVMEEVKNSVRLPL